jgi:hypothetical protein
MPLNKPPQSAKSTIDTGLRRGNSQNRRRTLQTVKELTSEDGIVNDTSPLETKNITPIVQIDQRASSRSSRRRSLPHEGTRTVPTSPFDWGRRTPQSPNRKPSSSSISAPNQFSVELTSTKKPLRRQVSNSKLRRHSLPCDGYSPKLEQPDESDQFQTSQLTSKGKGKQPVRAQDVTGRSTPVEGWNARRGSELKKREQEVVEARMRREQQRRGLMVGSSSTLPYLSPVPAKPNEIYIRGRANQQQLLQNSRAMNIKRSTSGLLVPRPSIATINGHTGNNIMDAKLLKSASTNNSLHLTAHYDSVQPPQFTRSTSNTTHIKNAASQGQSAPAPHIFKASISRTFSSSTIPTASRPPGQSHSNFPCPPPAALFQDRPSRTPSSQERSSRRSSVCSTTTTTTSLSTSTRRSRSTSSPHLGHSSSRRHHHNGVTKEHLDALASLTSSKPTSDGRLHESVGFPAARQRQPDDSLLSRSHSSSRHQNPLRPDYRPRSRTNSRASHHSYATTSNHSTTVDGDRDASPKIPMGPGSAATMGYGTGSESVRLLREREKLLRWKAEREKLEFEKRERDKVRERVRRANEMEEERRKEMDEKGKKERKCCACLVM